MDDNLIQQAIELLDEIQLALDETKADLKERISSFVAELNTKLNS